MITASGGIEANGLTLSRTSKSLNFYLICKLTSEPAEATSSCIRDKGPTCSRQNQPSEHHFGFGYPYSPNARGVIQKGLRGSR